MKKIMLMFSMAFFFLITLAPIAGSEVFSEPGNFSVSATIDSDCMVHPAVFTIGPGLQATNFQIARIDPGRECVLGGHIDMRGFTLRGGAVNYQYSKYKDNPPVVRGGPLVALVLAPGTYTLSLGGGNGAIVTLNFTIAAPPGPPAAVPPTGGVFYRWSQWKFDPPVEKPVPLANLVLGAGTYTLIAGGGGRAYATLQFTILAPAPPIPAPAPAPPGGQAFNDAGPGSVTARIDSDCAPHPAIFTIGPGRTAVNFQAQYGPGLRCVVGGVPDSKGYAIRGAAALGAAPPAPGAPGASEADISVTKTVGDSSPTVGDRVKFTVRVRNIGPDDATGVLVRDLLPGGVTYDSHDASQGVYNPAIGLWNVGAIANGSAETLTIWATVNQAGAITNVAIKTAVNEVDPDNTNDVDTATINAQTPPLTPPPTQVVTLIGTVIDKDTNQPIPGASVKIRPYPSAPAWEFTTDSAGRFQAGGLNPGDTVSITVSAKGYKKFFQKGTMGTQDPQRTICALTPAKAVLSGTVVDAKTGKRIAGASLKVTGPGIDKTISAPDGKFTIDGLSRGDTIQVTISAEKYKTISKTINITQDTSSTTFRLTVGEYDLMVWTSPANPAPRQRVTITVQIDPRTAGIPIELSVVGTDGYRDFKRLLTNANGQVTLSVPGAAKGVKDTVTVKLPDQGTTKILGWVF